MGRIMILLVTVLLVNNLAAEKKEHVLQLMSKAEKFVMTDLQKGSIYLDSLKEYRSIIKKKPELLARYCRSMGIMFFNKSQMDSAIVYFDKALPFYENQSVKSSIANIKLNKAMAFAHLGKFEKATKLSLDALRLFEKLDDKSGISRCHNLNAQVYFINKEYEKSLIYCRKFLNFAIQANDSLSMSSAYNNIGAVYQAMLEHDSSNYYFRKSLDIAREIGNMIKVNHHLQNIASNYMESGKMDKALQTYQEVLGISKSLGDSASVARIYLNLGKLHHRLEQHEKAEKYLLKAKDKIIVIDDRDEIQDVFQELHFHYLTVGDYRKALNFYKKSDSLEQIMFNEESVKNIEELRTQYETEKKDKQIELQNAALKQNELKLQRNSLLIGALSLLLIITALVFYLRYARIKQRQNIALQKAYLESQRERTRAVIQSQEKERIRFASDLHDGMGQLIAALGLNIRSIRKNSSPELLSNSTNLLEEIHTEIRNISFNLMPHTLTRDGLIPALRELVNRISKAGELSISLDVFEFNYRLKRQSEISIYRIIQEILSNIIKYSGAKNAAIQFTAYKDEIVLIIEDDGTGYDLDTFKTSDGNGWRNIASRIQLLDASIDIDTEKGRPNSTIVINIPVEKNKEI